MRQMLFSTGLACLALAGCVAPEPVSSPVQMALTQPSNAVECRMVYRKKEKDEQLAPSPYATSGGSLAGLLGAAIGSAIADGMNEGKRKRDLATCYETVGAATAERLPMDGPNRANAAQDQAAFQSTLATRY